MSEVVFVVMIEDRHCDPTVEVFSTEDAAINYAKAVVDKYSRDKSDIVESLTDNIKRAGWLYHATYSCEGDSVRVEREVVDGAKSP